MMRKRTQSEKSDDKALCFFYYIKIVYALGSGERNWARLHTNESIKLKGEKTI